MCIGDDKSSEKDLFYSVPQGSILGAEYYCLYSKPVTAIIRYHGMIYHIYADDSQLYITITPSDDISRLTANIERCVRDVNCWMSENMLKLNESKTEVIFFSAKKQNDPFADVHLTFGDSVIHPVREVRNLGVYLDQALTMEAHMKYVEKSCNFQIRNIHRIRPFLSDGTCKTLVQALVTSRLDYCNSLLVGIPKCDLHRLKKVQHSAARLVSRPNRSEDITSVLEELHWLQIPERIKFKVLLLTYKALHGESPDYILDLLRPYNPTRSLRFESRSPRLVSPKYEHERSGKRCSKTVE